MSGMTGLGVDSRGMIGALNYTVDSQETVGRGWRTHALARLGLEDEFGHFCNKKKRCYVFLCLFVILIVYLGNKDVQCSYCR